MPGEDESRMNATPVEPRTPVAGGSMSADIPWAALRAELVGTAALVLAGLSLVILMFGDGSPIPGVLPGVVRR